MTSLFGFIFSLGFAVSGIEGRTKETIKKVNKINLTFANIRLTHDTNELHKIQFGILLLIYQLMYVKANTKR